MTKKQKIWLAIFGAMFLVPEILWSPILGLWSIDKEIFNIGNRILLTIVVLLQFLGCLGLLFSIYNFKKIKNIFYLFILLFLSFCFLKLGYLLYLFYAVRNIQF